MSEHTSVELFGQPIKSVIAHYPHEYDFRLSYLRPCVVQN